MERNVYKIARQMDIKIYQPLPLQDPPKFTQILIFGLKIYHLATLHPTCFLWQQLAISGTNLKKVN
jgi:hypothetical protein